MDKSTVVEGNKTIADSPFVSDKQHDAWLIADHAGAKKAFYATLEYHSSWDWLMPVVEKIRGISYYDFNYQWNLISEAVLTFKVELVFYEVVDFIKWHNQYINQKANNEP